MCLISARISTRSLASRLDSGSSNSIRRGCSTSARAIATRCCWPPESCAGIAIARARQLHQLQHRVARAPGFRRRPALQLQAEGDVAEHRHMRKQRVVLEHHAEAALLRSADGRCAAPSIHSSPSLAGMRPATMLSAVDLPQPLGPEQGHELAAPHFEGEVVSTTLPPKRLVIPKRSEFESRPAALALDLLRADFLSQRSNA